MLKTNEARGAISNEPLVEYTAVIEAATCCFEHRVKTSNGSTMRDARLIGLCMRSVHKKRVEEETKFTDKLMNKFG